MVIIADCLMCPCKGSEMPLVDLFPNMYKVIPEVLLTSAYAYISTHTLVHEHDSIFRYIAHMHYVCLFPWLFTCNNFRNDCQGRKHTSPAPEGFLQSHQWRGYGVWELDLHQEGSRRLAGWPVSAESVSSPLAQFLNYSEHALDLVNRLRGPTTSEWLVHTLVLQRLVHTRSYILFPLICTMLNYHPMVKQL